MIQKDPLSAITVRKASIRDLDRIMKMENTVFASEAFSRRQYWHLLQSRACRILLYESDDGLEGMIVAGWHAHTDYVRIYSIAVSRPMRGLGLGTRMMRECLRLARELDRRWILLEVRVSNAAAIRLYRKFGFEEIGFLPDYYGDDQDGLRMGLEVPPATPVR